MFVHLFSFCDEEVLVCTSFFHRSLWQQKGGGGGCFMHAPICILKAKALGTMVKMQKVFRKRLLIHDALRKATYFRANPCYHWRSSPTEVIFHLRTCALMTVRGGAAWTEKQTPCSQHMQYQSREEEGNFLYITLAGWWGYASVLSYHLYNHPIGMNIQNWFLFSLFIYPCLPLLCSCILPTGLLMDCPIPELAFFNIA